MELRNLLMILFFAFLLLTLLTLLLVPRYDEEIQQVTVELGKGGCIADCGNDAVCIGRCKTAVVNQAVIFGDASKCDVLQGAENKACLEQLQFNQALAAADVGGCEGLSFVESCKNLIYFNKAVSGKDKAFCNQITDERMREMCNAA